MNLSIINSMAKVNILMLMGTTMMDNIKIIRDMEMVRTLFLIIPLCRENGL